MRMAFLTTRLEKPSARYRFLQYVPYLEKNGFSVESFIIPRGLAGRPGLFKSMRDFDVVFLQRKLLGAIEWMLLRRNAKRIVFDFDDAIMFRDSRKSEKSSAMRMRRFARTVAGADAVIAGNRYLGEWALKHNPNTFEVPTSIDMERYVQKRPSPDDGVVTLGWIGSAVTLHYIEGMKEVFCEAHRQFPSTRLKVVADRFFDCADMPVVKKQWNWDEEISDLHSFDVGLMPLTDDAWSRGKCGFKLLQCMAVGVASVASPVGVNSEIIRDGVNGFLAAKDNDWIRCLGLLIKDASLRKRLGVEARKTVIERYSVEKNAPRIMAVIRASIEAAAPGR
ncbi:MAG: glycosyltransferase family 4 protein [Deltaproteobacteria bacterium]|nr:glycosyltransferase family 4 protein [Deltaproteobacteria bacterium]